MSFNYLPCTRLVWGIPLKWVRCLHLARIRSDFARIGIADDALYYLDRNQSINFSVNKMRKYNLSFSALDVQVNEANK